MSAISENNNSFISKVFAAGLGWTGYTAARYSIYGIPYSKAFKHYSSKYPPQDIEKALKEVIKKYELNCDIVDINPDNAVSFIKSMKQGKPNSFKKILSQVVCFTPMVSNEKIIDIINKNPKKRSLYEKLLLKLNQPYQVALGNDASGSYSVKLNKSKNGLMGFHELGHVYHYKKGTKFIKLLLKAAPKCNNFMILPLGLNIISNSSDKFSEKQKQKIRQISPIAGMVLFLPRFTEEIIASIDGNKFAKRVCNKSMYKDIVRNNRVSMAVKAAQMLLIAFSIALGGIIPNKILTSKNTK